MESGASSSASADTMADTAVEDVLRALGASDEDVALAFASGRPASRAADVVLGRDITLTAADVASRLSMSAPEVLEIWRLLGVRIERADTVAFSDADVALTEALCGVGFVEKGGAELLRVLGTAMAKVAESAVALYVQTLEKPPGVAPSDEAAWAMSMASVVERSTSLGNRLKGLLGHHLSQAIALQRAAQAGVAEPAVFRLAVGFVDLVGSTPLLQGLAATEVIDLIGRFEEAAFDVVFGHGGRVVKYIGDEIMFVTVDPAEACRIACDLLATFRGRVIEPRGGLSFGGVVTRFGDYYGPVVNVAARLAEVAVPGEVLVDGAMAADVESEPRQGAPVRLEPGGRRLLKGFLEPLDVCSLVIAEAG